MRLKEFEELYQRNHLSEADFAYAKTEVLEFWDFMSNKSDDIDFSLPKEVDLDIYIAQRYSANTSTLDFFIALLRYFRFIGRNDLFIHLTRYTGILDVMDNILSRLKAYHDQEKVHLVLDGLQIPTLGISPKKIPAMTKEFVARLENHFEQKEVEYILTGNNHGLSKESMLPEKIEYENAPSLDVYLKERHQRKVAELTKFMNEKKVWFEQDITQEVVDFVASNQQVLSAELRDNKLLITKIPYDTVSFLNAKDAQTRKYFACHCGFAREAILQENMNVSENWCYCSAGFAKFPFEVILDHKLPIHLVESAIGEGELCRFEIDLTGIDYKK